MDGMDGDSPGRLVVPDRLESLSYVARDYHALSVEAAGRVAEFVRGNPGALLCLAAGDTPLGAFAELVRMQDAGEVDLGSVYYAGLDEWVGLGKEDRGSCWKVMYENFYGPARIPKERMKVFDGLAENAGRECGEMDEWVKGHGGIGLTLLGVGMNGHVGFNEPDAGVNAGTATAYDDTGVNAGTATAYNDAGDNSPGRLVVPDRLESLSYVVELDGTTRAVSVKYFGEVRRVSHGMTISLRALRQARKIIVMASGERKREIVRKAFCSEPTPEVPASMLQGHPDLILLTDFNLFNK